MASSVINVASAPAAAADAAARGSPTGAASASGSSLGLSFKDLLAGQPEADIEAGDASTLEDAELPAPAGGDDSPPGGNTLPQTTSVLPPAGLPGIAIESEAAAEPTKPPLPSSPTPSTTQRTVGIAADEVQSRSVASATDAATPGAASASAAQDRQLTSGAGRGSGDKAVPTGEAPRTALPPNAVQSQATQPVPQSAVAATPGGDSRKPEPAASAQAASAIAARLAGNKGGIDDAALRRLLTSLPAGTAAGRTPPAGHAAPLASGTPLPDDLQLAAAQSGLAQDGLALNRQPPVAAAGQLLRELKFDRAPDGVVSTPVTVTHAPGLQATTGATTNDAPVLQLNTPMHNRPEWANSLGERIIWMTGNNQQSAQIRLNPPHLGPIDVQVSVVDDKTSVSFTAHHAATRDALEAAVPRLREMLGQHGQTSVNVNINHHSSGQSSGQPTSEGATPESKHTGWGGNASSDADPPPPVTSATPQTRTLFDAYA